MVWYNLNHYMIAFGGEAAFRLVDSMLMASLGHVYGKEL